MIGTADADMLDQHGLGPRVGADTPSDSACQSPNDWTIIEENGKKYVKVELDTMVAYREKMERRGEIPEGVMRKALQTILDGARGQSAHGGMSWSQVEEIAQSALRQPVSKMGKQ